MPDLVLSIIATGTPQYPRFLVTDPQQRLWTGEGWSEEEGEGRLYICVNTAGRAIQEILLAQHGDKPLRRFTAPVHVDLYSDSDLTVGGSLTGWSKWPDWSWTLRSTAMVPLQGRLD
jgi:hypothetical protein